MDTYNKLSFAEQLAEDILRLMEEHNVESSFEEVVNTTRAVPEYTRDVWGIDIYLNVTEYISVLDEVRHELNELEQLYNSSLGL